MSAPSPALQRLRLRTELRRARTSAGLTQRQVAEKMEWSSSKLIRIEAGEVGISVNDLRPLLAAYGVTDRRRIETLLDLARGSRKMPFSEFRDIFGKEFQQYLDFESSASLVRMFNSLQIPGILQTEEYMRTIIPAYNRALSEETLERHVEARLMRQELLVGDEGAEWFFILDEAVIRRQVGGRGVMRKQLERLSELAAQPRITMMILPFSAGAHAGMEGPFTHFEFETDEIADLAYMENPRGDSYTTNEPEETGRYLERFWELEDLVVKDDVPELLRRLTERVETGSDDLVALLRPAEESPNE
ncbi:helix-turn-helix domain-containing protein [Streptomyces prunicolor]|uniref:helix-turn-helix domain-containing protein n=1 Tax=Streptomyces prunicolor TaxID=67348 RepID=UPI0034353F77